MVVKTRGSWHQWSGGLRVGAPLTASRMVPALPRGPASLAPRPWDEGDLVAGLPGVCAGVAASLTAYRASPSSACSPGSHRGTQSWQPGSLGCLALRLPWAEGSGSPLASHPARTVTQRDVSQIAGDSMSRSRRLRSSDLGAAADSARSPQGLPFGIAPGRVSMLSDSPAVLPTLVTGSLLHAGGQVRIPPPASFFPSSTHSLNIWLGSWARPLTWRSLRSSLGDTSS